MLKRILRSVLGSKTRRRTTTPTRRSSGSSEAQMVKGAVKTAKKRL